MVFNTRFSMDFSMNFQGILDFSMDFGFFHGFLAQSNERKKEPLSVGDTRRKASNKKAKNPQTDFVVRFRTKSLIHKFLSD